MDAPSVSIAVMPFRNLSPEPNTEFFATGFVEDLTTELTRFSSLRVLASQSTFGLSQTDRTVDDVVDEWDLQYLLEGSVRRGGPTLRVDVKLIRVEGRETVWADRFDAPFDSVFDIQDEITASVAGKLAVQIDDRSLGAARRESIENLAAYDCWLRGMECLKRGTLEGDDEARTFFRRALEIDPQYARAYSGLSHSYFNEITCQHWHLWAEVESNAVDFALKALELDDTDAMVHSVLARAYRFRHQHDQSDRYAARALALNANDCHVLIQLSMVELFNGEFKRSCELAQKAIQLNPLHPDWYLGMAGMSLFMLKRYDEAMPYLAKAGERMVNFLAYRAACAVMTGDIDRARNEYDYYEQVYQQKIAFGRSPDPTEAVGWAVQVEPYRLVEHSHRMPAPLRDAGLADLDVDNAIRSRRNLGVRPAEIAAPAGNAFVCEGKVWSIAYERTGASLTELKGFHDIRRLLAQPNQQVHCLELAGSPPTSDTPEDVLDEEARRQYRGRIEDLQLELEQAESDNDSARADRARVELDAIIDQLAKATGLGGRGRKIGDTAEKARSSVTWRIRNAIKKILAAHPQLGQHLSNSIRTGSFCIYCPENPTQWEL